MSYQGFREFPGYNRSRTQRFLTPRGWAVRLPDGRILYEGPMSRQGRRPIGYPPSTLGPIDRYPSPANFPGWFQGQVPGQFPEPSMRGFPGEFQGQSGSFPGQFLGQSSTQSSTQFPGTIISQSSSGQFPGVFISQSPGQSPAVIITPNQGQVTGQFTPLLPNNGWPAPPAPKARQRFRTIPMRVRVPDLKEDETECPICYRDYYSGDPQNEAEDAVRIPCGHVYGRRCLDKWIQENGTCPTCRGQLDLMDDLAGSQ